MTNFMVYLQYKTGLRFKLTGIRYFSKLLSRVYILDYNHIHVSLTNMGKNFYLRKKKRF